MSPRRAFSLVEVTLVFVLLAAAAALIMPRLLSSDQAATARKAQAALELTATAAVELASYTGTPSADLTDLETLAPRLTFVNATTPSTLATEISVAATTSSFIAAASDESGFCWGLILTLAGEGQSTVYLSGESASCTASLFTPHVGTTPPPDSGSSWSTPWMP